MTRAITEVLTNAHTDLAEQVIPCSYGTMYTCVDILSNLQLLEVHRKLDLILTKRQKSSGKVCQCVVLILLAGKTIPAI